MNNLLPIAVSDNHSYLVLRACEEILMRVQNECVNIIKVAIEVLCVNQDKSLLRN
jgi:hypothetical protein